MSFIISIFAPKRICSQLLLSYNSRKLSPPFTYALEVPYRFCIPLERFVRRDSAGTNLLKTLNVFSFFCDDGKCFVLFFCCHFLLFVYDLTVSQARLRYHSTQNLMRKTVALSDGRRVGNSCRNPFLCDDGVLFCSAVVTFYILYIFSPFLKHGLYI
jgi:hypothetical protein